jgi:hypothetical protein
MFKLSDYFNVLCEEADPDKSGGGGKTFTQEEVDALVAGLKSNNDKLLAEKKEAKRLADEAAAAKLLADQDAAKKSGELEAFEKTLRSQYDTELAAKDKALQARSERILTSEKKAIVSSLSGMLIDESATELLGMLVRTEFDGDDVVTKFVGADGAVITTDVEQFKKYLCEHKAFSHLIKADAATGGGANGGKFRGGATNFASMTLTEKAKLANENPALYAQLSGKK